MKKCLICTNLYTTESSKKCFSGLCPDCISSSYIPCTNKKQRNREEFQKKIYEAMNKIESFLDLLKFKKDLPKSIPEPSYPVKISKKPNPTLKIKQSSIIFYGEVRSLNEKEKNDSSNLSCPYCKLNIDRKLYFYPLVILNCGDGYFHRNCFAEFIAKGEYHCPTCTQNFFKPPKDSDSDDNFF